MWTWLGPLLNLLGFVADQIKRVQRREREEARDREQSEIQSDPVEFGRNHFNGVRERSELPDDADGSSQTGAEQLEDERAGRREP